MTERFPYRLIISLDYDAPGHVVWSSVERHHLTMVDEANRDYPGEMAAARREIREAVRESREALIRDILVAMARKHGVSMVSPFDPDDEARNYLLAQRLGIGSVFGMPDEEDSDG